MIDIKCGTLFTVEILHNYFSNHLCNDFTIIPSASTQKALDGYRLFAAQSDNQLAAGTGLDLEAFNLNLMKPFIIPQAGMQLTFSMLLNNPVFINYSNLPTQNFSGNIYYFTNRNNSVSGGKKRLSSTAFVSAADSLKWLPSIYTYVFSTAQTQATFSVSGYNTTTHDYSVTVLSGTINFPSPVLAFQLNLSSLPAGKYILTVNGSKTSIYLNDELIGQNAFAILDLYNDANLPAAYALLNTNNTLLSPLYTIYFNNRSTIWKYNLKSTGTMSITDPGPQHYAFTNPSPGVLVSSQPIPLTDSPLNLKLAVNGNTIQPLACPTPDRIVLYNSSPCSEVFINF